MHCSFTERSLVITERTIPCLMSTCLFLSKSNIALVSFGQNRTDEANMGLSNQELVLSGDVGSCLDLLWKTRRAESVIVDFSNDAVSKADCLTLFRSLANYPGITSLHVNNPKKSLPLKALSAVISNPGCSLRHSPVRKAPAR